MKNGQERRAQRPRRKPTACTALIGANERYGLTPSCQRNQAVIATSNTERSALQLKQPVQVSSLLHDKPAQTCTRGEHTDAAGGASVSGGAIADNTRVDVAGGALRAARLALTAAHVVHRRVHRTCTSGGRASLRLWSPRAALLQRRDMVTEQQYTSSELILFSESTDIPDELRQSGHP